MNPGQLIIVGIGVLILLSGIDFSSLLNIFSKKTITTITPTKNETIPNDSLISVVSKWDDLQKTCQKLGLKEAEAKLNEIFPMLIKVNK